MFITTGGRHFYVINGCTETRLPKDWPERVTSENENKRYAVRCCNQDGNICYSRIRDITKEKIGNDSLHCPTARKTYKEANDICAKNGLRLCSVQEKRVLPLSPTVEQNPKRFPKELCCTTGCKLGYTNIWTSTKGR